LDLRERKQQLECRQHVSVRRKTQFFLLAHIGAENNLRKTTDRDEISKETRAKL